MFTLQGEAKTDPVSVLAGATDQVGAEGEHQNTGAVLKEFRDGVHFKTHHHLESGDNQSNDDDFCELVFERIQRVDIEQIASFLRVVLLTNIDIRDDQFINSIAKNQQSNSNQLEINPAHDLAD